MTRHTPEEITELEPGEIFVFGSNLAGVHGAGAALLAYHKFGAVYGIGEGLQGRSYALPTKDARLDTLPLEEELAEYILRFVAFARLLPDKIFLVTKIGCGIAGYTPADIAPLWPQALPTNIILPLEFQHEQKN